jgi:hypothetical protein
LVLAITGSIPVKEEDQKVSANSIQRCKLALLEGQGHEIYVTRVDKFQNLFLDFLTML